MSYNTYQDVSIEERSAYNKSLEVIRNSFSAEPRKSDLSSFTRVRNHLARKDIDKYHHSQEMESFESMPKQTTDATNLLLHATRELRCLTYKISTVVSSGDYHQDLEPSVVNNVEIIENMMIY